MRTVRVGRLAGIPIGFQPLWLAIVALITWSLGAEYFPSEVDGIAPEAAYGLGLLCAVLLFASILLHELGHAVVARRRGVEIEEIDLWLLGGVARMRTEPQRAEDELAFAAAGPAVTAVFAVVFAVAHVLVTGHGVPALRAVVDYQLYVNAAILVLNLLPAFPLDGGRIARAVLWRRTGDHDRATAAASRAGRGFGLALFAFGMLTFLSGAAGGIWFAFIGGFLIVAASAEEQQVRTQRRMAGQTVASLMSAPVVSIPADVTIADAVSAFFVRHLHGAFPVVDAEGRVVGLLTMNAVRLLPVVERARLTAGVAALREPALLVAPATPIGDVLTNPAFARVRRVVAVDDLGRPVGILADSDIQRWLQATDLLGGPGDHRLAA